MTDLERINLLVALHALQNASEWYQQESKTRAQMVTGLFARKRNAKLIALANKAKCNGDAQIAEYREITDQIPRAWYTAPMCERLITLVENGYGENVKDLVSHYKYYVRDSEMDGRTADFMAGAGQP